MSRVSVKHISIIIKYIIYASFVSLSIYFDQALAQRYASTTTGAGKLASDMMEPVSFFSNMLHAACLILGTSFLFASIVKYFEHKRSPLMVTMSTVVFLFLGGLLLLSIPLFSYFFSKSYGINL